ncbi:hypothetical protein B566_EDAN010471 [Ephemera danica]|nr:hypothetical protein B566_EDAN010471 [Ephemera danica]
MLRRTLTLTLVISCVFVLADPNDPLLSPDYEDAILLREAMKGLGTDEEALINILAHRTETQRLLIEQAYHAHTGRVLLDDLKHELSGTLEDVVVGLMQGRNLFLASRLHEALHTGSSAGEETLADIICPRSYDELTQIVATYDKMFAKPLEADLAKDKSTTFRRLIYERVSACNSRSHQDSGTTDYLTPVTPARVEENTGIIFSSRSDLNPLTIGDAKTDAEVLYNAGKGLSHANEKAFTEIMTQRSEPELRNILREYSKKTKRSFEETIREQYTGPMKSALLAIAMYGLGTDEDALTCIFVSRAEIDLYNIKRQYERLYDHTLEADIRHEVSGHYESALQN